MATYKALGPEHDVAFTADADLTQSIYYFVTPASTAGNVKVATGASNPAPFGVLQNAPSAGQEAQVRLFGSTKVFAVTPAGSGIAYGRYVTVNASGQAIPQATEAGSPVLGRWMDTGAPVSASRYGNIILFPMAACAVSAS